MVGLRVYGYFFTPKLGPIWNDSVHTYQCQAEHHVHVSITTPNLAANADLNGKHKH